MISATDLLLYGTPEQKEMGEKMEKSFMTLQMKNTLIVFVY